MLDQFYQKKLETLGVDSSLTTDFLRHRIACALTLTSSIPLELLEVVMSLPSEVQQNILEGAYKQAEQQTSFLAAMKYSVQHMDDKITETRASWDKTMYNVLIGSPHRQKDEIGLWQKQLAGLEQHRTINRDVFEPIGLDVGPAKQACAEKALGGYSHLLLLDDDVYPFHPGFLRRLLNYNLDVVCGVYNVRRDPHVSCPIKLDTNGKRDYVTKTDSGLIPAYVVSGGLVLIKTSVFGKLGSRPWFKNTRTPNGAMELTEDAYFSTLCRDNGIEMFIDTDVRATHWCRETQCYW